MYCLSPRSERVRIDLQRGRLAVLSALPKSDVTAGRDVVACSTDGGGGATDRWAGGRLEILHHGGAAGAQPFFSTAPAWLRVLGVARPSFPSCSTCPVSTCWHRAPALPYSHMASAYTTLLVNGLHTGHRCVVSRWEIRVFCIA